jgi:hypothetical protein
VAVHGNGGRAGISARSETVPGAIPAALPETENRAADSAPSAVRGVVELLVAGAVSFAVREAAAYVGQAAAGLMGATKPPETNDHD